MQKVQKIKSNENLYQIFFLLSSSLPIFVVNILFYATKGFNFKQIMSLQAISSLVVILLEVPSGVLADMYSRKNMILIGMLCSIIDLLLILVCKQYFWFIVAALLGGVAEAFISGSDMAMIYDHFQQNKKEDLFEEYFASISSKKFIVFSASTLIGGSLFGYNPALVVVISLVFQVIAMIAIFLFEEHLEKNKLENISIKSKFLKHFTILKQTELFNIVILFLILTLTVSTLNQLSQQYLVEINFNIKFLGLLFFIFNIVSAIGSRYYIYTKKLGVTKMVLLFSIIMFSLSQIYSVGAIAILIIARFFTSGIWPSINVEFNKLIESEDRASIISYKNLLISISFVFVDPINGIIIDFKNVHYVYFVFAVILLIYFMKRIIKKSHAN